MSPELPAPSSAHVLCHAMARAAPPNPANKKATRLRTRIALRTRTPLSLAPLYVGGDGGNRTRVRNIRPETSTSLVDLSQFCRRSSDQHEAHHRLADSLRQRYRRTAAAAHSLCRQPPSLLAPPGRAVALLKEPVAYLGRRSRGSGRGETKVESHACVLGICMCLRLFYVVDALRLAVSGLTMPRRSRSSPSMHNYS